jgi:hypothetical protein
VARQKGALSTPTVIKSEGVVKKVKVFSRLRVFGASCFCPLKDTVLCTLSYVRLFKSVWIKKKENYSNC